MIEAIRKNLFNIAKEKSEKNRSISIFTESQESLRISLSLGFSEAYGKTDKTSNLKDQEYINFFLDESAQDFLFSNAPNAYWAWTLINKALIKNETEKITKNDFYEVCKDIKELFLTSNKSLSKKYLDGNVSTVETLLLGQTGYLLIGGNGNNIKAIVNPLFL